MRSKPYHIALIALLLSGHSVSAAELGTLFTTAAEREIINANRYKSVDIEIVRPQPEQPVIELPVEQTMRQEVTLEYQISGITLSSDGAHMVWINSIAYEDGESLDDSSRIKVLTGNEIQVRITAPDGTQYFGTSGQTLEVTYLAPVEN